MQRILEKNLEDLTIVVATNANGELKIGSDSDYEGKRMSAFSAFDNAWYGVDMELLHLKHTEDGVYCNVGIDLPIENSEFPYKLFTPEEVLLLQTKKTV